ncbi:TPA: hypothetical protein ACNRRD_006237 [Pseudomonas aeruginosa]|uniref:hypothetical protein n=1 Tax=Pseudomonas aeruginosa TaxID=287 RepID=UPI000F78B427|nr:hypothetical protein [Pseudomonas aeruginosa]MBO8290033.1 hypothetical protein [Pseudomonas aeruginosa]MBR7205812.1 hypothetical protein [Pseudomonas aeruginosa]MDG3612168.1 hypothetical protein [Pseudomonas aeruginosa]MDG3612888.1 hypothetical protein [Pseudomonas aeruginosa]MDG3629215.1 hypothetical protein [Pseudomonas aeruginosa]
MIQVAILVVLIIIAFILAPWLIGVAVALVAAYGIWLVLSASIVVVIGISFVIFHGLREYLFYNGSGISEKIDKVNEEFLLREKNKQELTPDQPEEPKVHQSRKVALCKHCGGEIRGYTLYCPSCGKST